MNRLSRQFRFWYTVYGLIPKKRVLLRKITKIFYKILFQNVYKVDISLDTKIGKNLIIHHGYGLVVHPLAVLGNNVVLRHCTTIGERNGHAPIVGDDVNVGCHSVIIGDISIGSKSHIGVGSVVVDSVPKNSIVYGSKAKCYSRSRSEP